MALYKGVVREIYEYEIDIDAKCHTDAMEKLKKMYTDNSMEGVEKVSGLFVADALNFIRAEYAIKSTEEKEGVIYGSQ